MSRNRCQVCGRPAKLNADGAVGSHYRRGFLCAGVGRVPYELGEDAIVDALAAARREANRFQAIFQDHSDRRLNAPLERGFWEAWSDASSETLRLDRRLANRRRRQAALSSPSALAA